MAWDREGDGGKGGLHHSMKKRQLGGRKKEAGRAGRQGEGKGCSLHGRQGSISSWLLLPTILHEKLHLKWPRISSCSSQAEKAGRLNRQQAWRKKAGRQSLSLKMASLSQGMHGASSIRQSSSLEKAVEASTPTGEKAAGRRHPIPREGKAQHLLNQKRGDKKASAQYENNGSK